MLQQKLLTAVQLLQIPGLWELAVEIWLLYQLFKIITNFEKTGIFLDINLMAEKIELLYKENPNVHVVLNYELTSSLAKKHDAIYLLRGLRNTPDFEYENTISQMNRYLNEDLETVFLITSPQFAAISSTIIREIHRYGGDVREFLPYEI